MRKTSPTTWGSSHKTLDAVLQELVTMLEEEELKDAVLVVLANKQDIEGAMSVTEVHGALGLDKLKNRTFQIFKVRYMIHN